MVFNLLIAGVCSEVVTEVVGLPAAEVLVSDLVDVGHTVSMQDIDLALVD